MDPALLQALAEPNRLRIVELLGDAPRPVGEIADALGLRQPQATKHLQTLERAGLVAVYPLGRRRVYALRRAPLRELRAWLAAFEDDLPSEETLAAYARAIAAERGQPRTLTFERTLEAGPAEAWRWWTTADAVRRWWAPEHFTVADATVDAAPGGRLRIVLAEGDGTRHTAAGRFVSVRRPERLSFELAPLDDAGEPLFAATHEVRLDRQGRRTRLRMAIGVSGVRLEAALALAGMQLGWAQTLDRLAGAIAEARGRRRAAG